MKKGGGERKVESMTELAVDSWQLVVGYSHLGIENPELPSALSFQPSTTQNDPWGNVTSHTGALSQPYQFVGRFGYYAHWIDSNLPYIQTGVRLYFPQLGRYVQRDSLRYGLNHYLYTSNDPISTTDPLGLFDLDDPEDVKMIKTYICQTGCLLELAGIPWQDAWNGDIWKIIKEKSPGTINDVISIITKYIEK